MSAEKSPYESISTGEFIRKRYKSLLNYRRLNVVAPRVNVNPAVHEQNKKMLKSKSETKPKTLKLTMDNTNNSNINDNNKNNKNKNKNEQKDEVKEKPSKKPKAIKSEEWVRANPLPVSSPPVKIAHQIRLAVHLGNGCIDPDQNPQLRNILREIWELGLPQEEVQRILRQCKMGGNKLNSYKLQIRYRRNIYLICCVQVGQLLSAKKKLIPILKEFNASFQYAMDVFKNVGLIEAFVKPMRSIDFEQFDAAVRSDGYDCKAKALEIIDYSTGSVCFSCNPLHIQNAVKALRAKGYEIVYTENGFRATLLVDMNWIERSNYAQFIEKLYEINEITHIYDNVRTLDVPFEPVVNLKE